MSSVVRDRALEIAATQIGVREAGGKNRGPQVDGYLVSVGLDPKAGSYAWCAAFVHWSYEKAAAWLAIMNPWPRVAGVLRAWDQLPSWARVKEPLRGAVFFMDKGKGLGHCGFVEVVTPGGLVTIEGNTDGGGSREGDGVYRRTRRFDEVNVGYADLGADDTLRLKLGLNGSGAPTV